MKLTFFPLGYICSVIMADAKQGKTPIDGFYSSSSQSRVVLAKPRLGGFGVSSFTSSSNKGCNQFGSILRPSQLKPGNNPFLKAAESESTAKEDSPKEEGEDRLKDAKEEAEAPKFVPLGSVNVTPRTVNPVPNPGRPVPGSSGFIFGENLNERVVIQEGLNNGEAPNTKHNSSNGTTAAELLFTSAAATVKENQEETTSGEGSNSTSGLAAAAAEYERSHAKPPPRTTTCTLTGEEGETNVLQISCRLFAWETGSWRERGRGVLRLNEAGETGAGRLVARVAGSLRVVLNTKLWPGMVVERAGTKSLRITAVDAQQQVKLFLIMGAPGDIAQLHRALTARISVCKWSTPNTCSQNATSQKAAERLEAAADESDYLVKPEEGSSGDKETTHEDDDTSNDRLEEQKTEEYESNVDGLKESNESKCLKRKEPVEDDTSLKRQCLDKPSE